MTDHSAIAVGNIRTRAGATQQLGGVARSSAGGDPAQPCAGAAGSGQTDDVALMAGVARGDAEAQRQVTRRLLARVEGLCRALLPSSNEALTARERSIVEILKSAHRFDGASPLENWADCITVRGALRAASERSALPAPVGLERDTAPSSTDAVLLTRQYLDHLSERQRMVMVMRCRLDYSIEEIAELMGSPQRAVEACLRDARGVMRRMCRREQLLVDISGGKVVG